MSGEFGWIIINGAYAHRAIELTIEAMEQDSEYPLTAKFIEFMDKVQMIARDVAYVEAGDNSYNELDLYAVDEAIKALQAYRVGLVETLDKLRVT